MPLLLALKFLNPLFVIQSLGLAHLSKHILNSRHHSLQSTEVDVSTVVQLVENLIGILLNLILNVHLSSILVLLFTRKSIVQTEVLGITSLSILELVIVKKSIGVGNSEEQPCLTLVGGSGGGVLEEETTDERTEGGDTSSGGYHDVIRVGIFLGHEHDLTGGSGHHNLGTGLGVTQEVGADTLLGRIVGLELGAPVGSPSDAERSSLSGHVVSVPRGGDGVKTDRVGLSVLLAGAGGNDSPGLSLPVGEVTVVIDDDVACFSGGLGSDNAFGGDDLSGEGGLVFVSVGFDGVLGVVGFGLEEVLLEVERGSVKGERY
jgi:hypothetical protein